MPAAPSADESALGPWPIDARRRARTYRLLGPPASALTRLLAPLRVEGAGHVPRRGPALLVANHVSYRDPVALAVLLYRLGRWTRFVAAAGVFGDRRAGWLLRRAGMIHIERGSGAQALHTAVAPVLDAGETVLVYPEGRMVPDGRRVPGRPGVGLAALRADAPVVPLATAGLEPVAGLAKARARRRAGVAFGPPLDLSTWAGREDPEACHAASDAMLAAIRSLRPRAERLRRRG